jgi:Holliday junction resolvase RusA-like endonuclease
MRVDYRSPTFDDDTLELDPPGAKRLFAVTFHGRPGTANVTRSATTRAWMDQVRSQAAGLQTHWTPDVRFWARIDFRLYMDFNPKAEWDPDNLLKAFFDALCDAGFFGDPAIAGSSMKGDERIDYIQVRKRTVSTPEEAGARIELYAVTKP